MCASYNPPNEYITQFNTRLFNQPEDTLSQAEANQLYLSKRTSDISTAPLTTFNGQVSFNNEAPISNTTPSIPSHLATLSYLTSFYQPISLMVNYLTTSVASATYQTIANMTNYVSRTGSITEDITGTKTFTGTIKSNNYDTQTATTALTIGASVTSGDINIGRNKTSGFISIGTGFSQLNVYSATSLKVTTIEIGSDFNVRNIVSTEPSSTNHTLFTNMITNGVLTIGNALSSNTINGASTFNQAISASGTLKTTSIVPITANAQHEIFYNNIGASGTLFIGTTGRTMNLYGNANFSTNCQVSGDFKTDDITAINNASTQSIYTTLTSTGAINLGSTTTGTTTNIRGGAISIGGLTNDLTIESPTKFNTKINFYSGTTNYTEFLQTSVQLTLKPVHNNGTIALHSTNSSGVQTEQLLINSSGVSTSTLSSTNIYSGNYNTGDGFLTLGSNTTTQNISIGAFLTTGNINIGNTTAGTFKTNIRGTATFSGSVVIRTDKLVDELQTLTTTSETLVFPLHQTTIFTNTGNISVTLPLINNDRQIGLTFNFLNLGSITTTTTFNRQGTNLIIPVGQMTQYTSTALINNTYTSISLVIVKLGGVYMWAEY